MRRQAIIGYFIDYIRSRSARIAWGRIAGSILRRPWAVLRRLLLCRSLSHPSPRWLAPAGANISWRRNARWEDARDHTELHNFRVPLRIVSTSWTSNLVNTAEGPGDEDTPVDVN